MGRRALIQGIGALVAFALAGIALASAGDLAPESAGARTDIELLAGRGPIKIVNSRGGRAIVSARNMAPGTSRAGTVRVSVRGRPARVSLGVRRLRSPPGPYGGRLANALVVTLRKVGAHKPVLFRGDPRQLRRVKLGRWRRGKARRYRLRVRFPGSEPSQNRLQGARASFAVVWQASRA